MLKYLSSKARTLDSLSSAITRFSIPELIYFNLGSFNENPSSIINRIKRKFNGRVIVIRSSAVDEDEEKNASAGEYDSVLNVSSDKPDEIVAAIDVVISSFNKKRVSCDEDEIIVQEMLLNTCVSGVVFTHELNTGAPYYVINYDDVSGDTDTVTSGGGEHANRTLYVHRGALKQVRSDRFLNLLLAVEELELVTDNQFLDIEFALDCEYRPYLLQARPITTRISWNSSVPKNIDKILSGVQSFVKDRFKRVAGVSGDTTVLGQMPDWNPVEMIGRAPRALAYSLYQTLITDSAWAIAREKMDYAVPSGRPLMVSLAGQPYIDTRLSFNSYLPSSLPETISEKLVNAWISRLKSNPELHDKVEFDVAITTYSFDIDEKIEALVGSVLNSDEKNEFKLLIRNQTNNLLIGDGEYSIAGALHKIDLLSKKHLTDPIYTSSNQDLSTLFPMINDCITLGTIPFSILARHGFIARTLLLSLTRRGIITSEDMSFIQSSIRTVASELVDDMHGMQTGSLSQSGFMARYGHLRPGTYDILSHRYDQILDLGMNKVKAVKALELDEFNLSDKKMILIDKLLDEEGFQELDAKQLIEYVRTATIGREYGKFVFTRSVSDMLELIAHFGEGHGMSRDEMSHIPIDRLLEVHKQSSANNVGEYLRSISQIEEEKHLLSVAIRLPQVLSDTAGVHVIPFQVSHPNFITNNKITAPIVILNVDGEMESLSGKIVLIENADPGYDWILAQKIGGLITKYGGANSHMAIRCAEFEIPAAIGCGDQRYNAIADSNQVLLDCASGLIKSTH